MHQAGLGSGHGNLHLPGHHLGEDDDVLHVGKHAGLLVVVQGLVDEMVQIIENSPVFLFDMSLV